jgi:hypothetical protein
MIEEEDVDGLEELDPDEPELDDKGVVISMESVP